MAPRRRTSRVPLQTGPDWSNLPDDVIQIISEKIEFKEQYDHLRLVCQQWKCSCPPNPGHLICQFPWLMLPRSPSSSSLSLYDFSHPKLNKFDVSVVTDKVVYGHSRGWFLLGKDNEFSLVNPITKEIKSNCCPPLAADPIILAFARNERTRDPSHAFPRIITPGKVVLTSSPSDEGCIVIILVRNWGLGFCQVGGHSWTILQLEESGPRSGIVLDFKYRNGLVYAMSNKGQVIVYDLRDLSKKILIGNISCARRYDKLYLVIGEGELDGVPLIVRHITFPRDEFEVYKCTNGKERSRWSRVRNIGNSVLLVGANEQCEIISLCNIQLDGWEGNQVCYCSQKPPEGEACRRDTIKTINIGNGCVKEMPDPLGVLHPERYFYINWFTPSLC